MTRVNFYNFDNNIINECMENLLPYITQFGEYVSDFSVFKLSQLTIDYNIECIINDQDYFPEFQAEIESSSNWKIKNESKDGQMCEYIYIPDDDDLRGRITLEIILEI